MIWVAGRSPTLVSQNLKATTLTYLAIVHLEIQSHLLPLASLLPFLEHDKGSTTHMTTPCALACQLLEPRRNL
jgi:hypothetical protein